VGKAWWKWLGLAGAVGVVATGAVIARQERQRRAYTPDEVRERLQRRLAEVEPPAQSADRPTAPPRSCLGFLKRR
jgi:hypothetical protein